MSDGMVLECVALLGTYDAPRKRINVENICVLMYEKFKYYEKKMSDNMF